MASDPNTSMPIKLGDLLPEVEAAAEATGLSRPDIVRLSVERGLPVVLKGLGKTIKARKRKAA